MILPNFNALTQTAQSVGQAAQQAAENVADAANDAAAGAAGAASTAAASAVSTASGTHEAAKQMIATPIPVAVGGSLSEIAAVQIAEDFAAMTALEAQKIVVAAGHTGAEAHQIVETIVNNLAASAPSWDELQKIEDTLTALQLPALPPELMDTESPPHDGEVYVVDASKDGDDRISQREVGADEDVIYYTNGMMTPPGAAQAQAEEMSRRTGKPVVLVYSAREGFVQDVLQGIADKVDPFGIVNRNPATDADAELMYQAAKNGEERHFVAHSRGTIVTRNALMRTHTRLYSEHFTENLSAGQNPVQAHTNALRRANDDIDNIHVISAAGAAWTWPPYANVEHISNVQDPIPNAFGQTVLTDPRDTFYEMFGYDIEWLPTQDNVHITNENDSTGIGHGFNDGYLDDILLAM